MLDGFDGSFYNELKNLMFMFFNPRRGLKPTASKEHHIKEYRGDNMYISIILTLIMVKLGFICYLMWQDRKPYFQSAPPIADERAEVVEEVDPFSEAEVKRKAEFNNRISRIKEELALETARRKNKVPGESAVSLHPDVYNLPHDSIPTSTIPDVEYAD